MRMNIYFADKTVLFTDQKAPEYFFTVDLLPGEDISRTKVLNFLENHNFVAFHTPQPEQVCARFNCEFTSVEAAGGVVVNDCGEWLMIHRNGRWDLPKGHVESGEDFATCAVREVAEETGVVGAEVVRFLCDTLHAYWMHDRWELKHTHWYELHSSRCEELIPQREEGIERVEWCSPRRVEENLHSTFPTIRLVVECMRRE